MLLLFLLLLLVGLLLPCLYCV